MLEKLIRGELEPGQPAGTGTVLSLLQQWVRQLQHVLSRLQGDRAGWWQDLRGRQCWLCRQTDRQGYARSPQSRRSDLWEQELPPVPCGAAMNPVSSILALAQGTGHLPFPPQFQQQTLHPHSLLPSPVSTQYPQLLPQPSPLSPSRPALKSSTVLFLHPPPLTYLPVDAQTSLIILSLKSIPPLDMTLSNY